MAPSEVLPSHDPDAPQPAPTRPAVAMLLTNPFEHDSRVLKEARSAVAAGFDVTVVALPRNGLPSFERRDGFDVVRLGRESGIRYIRRFVWYARCLAWCLRHRPHVVHVNDFDPLAVGCLVAKLTGAGVIYDSHELWVSATEMLRRSAWMRWFAHKLEPFLARRADAVFHADWARAQVFARQYDLPDLPLVLSNCPTLQVVEKTDLLRRTIGVGPEARILIYSGGLARGRGIEPTLRAVELLPPHVHMVFMGFGDRHAIDHFRRTSPSASRVHYVPAVPYDQIIPMIASADIGLALIQNANRSYYLGAPTKLYEYMMAGIPAVASNFPEIARVLADVPCGVLVDPDDPSQIAAAVMKLLDDPRLYAEYQANARQGRIKYCWENQVGALLDVYRRIAARKGFPAA